MLVATTSMERLFRLLLKSSRSASLIPPTGLLPAVEADGAESPVLMLYTSGTTGQPKGVVLTQNALVWSARNSVAMHDMTADDRILMVLPMFHAGGFNIQTLAALYVVIQIALPPADDEKARAIYKRMQEELEFNPRATLEVA